MWTSTLVVLVLTMKRYLSFFMIVCTTAFAEDIEFNLNCKVTAQEIIETNDGVVKKYSHYTGRVQIGESFPINFQFNNLDPSQYFGSTFELIVSDPSKAMGLTYFIGSSLSLNKANKCNQEYLNCDLLIYKDDDYLKRTFKNNDGVEWNISPNEINGVMLRTLNSSYGANVLGLKRYYKNDWELKFSSSGEDRGIHYLTANCMGMPSKFDRLLQVLRDEYDKKY